MSVNGNQGLPVNCGSEQIVGSDSSSGPSHLWAFGASGAQGVKRAAHAVPFASALMRCHAVPRALCHVTLSSVCDCIALAYMMMMADAALLCVLRTQSLHIQSAFYCASTAAAARVCCERTQHLSYSARSRLPWRLRGPPCSLPRERTGGLRESGRIAESVVGTAYRTIYCTSSQHHLQRDSGALLFPKTPPHSKQL